MMIDNKPQTERAKLDPRVVKVLVIMLLVVLLIGLFLYLPFLRMRDFVVSGNYTVSAEEIVQASGLKSNEHFWIPLGSKTNNWLTFKYKYAANQIVQKYPNIRSAEITFAWPGKVQIEVEERLPIAILEYNGQLILLDSESNAIGIADESTIDLPVIQGIQVKSLRLGEKVQVAHPQQLRQAVNVLAQLILADNSVPADFQLPQLTKTITAGADGHFTLQLEYQHHEYSVKCLSNSYLKDNFVWLKKVLLADYLKDHPAGIIDLTGKNHYFAKPTVAPTTVPTTEVETIATTTRTIEQVGEEKEKRSTPNHSTEKPTTSPTP